MSRINYASVKNIARYIKQMKEEENRSTVLLLGAGVSVSAGVPLADHMVKELRSTPKYAGQLEDIDMIKGESEYNMLMRSLFPKQRQEYIRAYIDKAKINLAHLYIGSLIKEGYVDSVLTTNFDPLLVKTMALFNKHTYVYDLANVRNYVSNSIMYPNIFYLHGQGHAFLMLNTETELHGPRPYLKTLINDMMDKHCFLVVGYSGSCDFVFKELCDTHEFPHGLFWVGYKSKEPVSHIKENICCKESVRYTDSNGADSFFRDLANELGVNTRSFIDTPFEHLREMLQNIGDLKYNDGTEDQNVDLLTQPNIKIDAAIDLVENGKAMNYENEIEKVKAGKLNAELQNLLLKNRFSDVIERENEILNSGIESAKELLAWAYSQQGYSLGNIAEQKNNNEEIYFQAFESYKKSTQLSEIPTTWYNWGLDLGKLAATKDENEDLLLQSIEKYKQAIKIKPDMYWAWGNWGNILVRLAMKKKSEELYHDAFQKYETTLKLIPDSDSTLTNWGCAIASLAESKNNNEEIYNQAFEKYHDAIKLNNDNAMAWYNWGTDLGKLAEAKNLDEQLYNLAFEKYAQAVRVKPDYYEAWYNWGTDLSKLADSNNYDEQLYSQAFEKFAQALRAKPDSYDAMLNWGIALEKLGEAKDSEDFLIEASEKYKEASRSNPRNEKALNCLGTNLLTRYKKGKDKSNLIKAIDTLIAAYAISEKGLYNLTCAYALNGDRNNALHYLEKTLISRSGLKRKFIEADEDLVSLQSEAKFKRLLDKYLPVETT